MKGILDIPMYHIRMQVHLQREGDHSCDLEEHLDARRASCLQAHMLCIMRSIAPEKAAKPTQPSAAFDGPLEKLSMAPAIQPEYMPFGMSRPMFFPTFILTFG